MMEEEEIRVVRCGGSNINDRRAVFSANSLFLFCVSGDFIKVFSTSTQECIHVLQGHSAVVTGIELNPRNYLQLYSCSLDGTIKLWDFMDGILIKNFIIDVKLFGLYTAVKEDLVYAIVPKNNGGASDTFQLVSVKLPKSVDRECEAKEMSVISEYIRPSPKCTAVGRDDEYIATVNGLNLLVYYLKNKKCFRFSLGATSKKGGNNIFTVVKCHPYEDCIATGHKDGKIRLWRNFNHDQEYTYSTLHWHHDAVADLAFSVHGTVLFSGGVESVLVQWSFSLEQKKEFLPRLGAAIEHISTSPDGSLHCTSHKDNKITIIDVGLKTTGIIQGLVKGTNVKTGLIFDPRSKALVLNGKPGHLQFYSLHDDKQLFNLDIVQQEFVHQSGLQYMDLDKAAFSSKGDWLATVEELQGNTKTPDVQMKLWEFNEQLQSFVLNTTISMPHEANITSLAFQNRGDSEKDHPSLVTTGNDGLFKVWVLRDNSDIYKQSTGWSCDFVGSYHKNKALGCCFSEDGSLFAAGFEEVITIWETSAWELKHTFCQPPGKVRSLCFGRLNCSKYLVASTDSGFINCWDLLTCSLAWRAQTDATVLQPDLFSENIAAFTFASGSSNLFIFNPTDPMPLYVHENVCEDDVQWAVFVPRIVPAPISSVKHSWLVRSQLYFLTETQDLLTFSTKSPEESMEPIIKQMASEESLPYTPFYTLFGKKHQQDNPTVNSEKTHLAGHKAQTSAVKEVFFLLLHTPAHVLPPPSVLCTMFVNSLLISKPTKCPEPVSKDIEAESENTDAESDEDLQQPTESQDPVPSIQDPIHSMFPATYGHLTKAQEKLLKRIRKTDFSWVADLCENV
ncbi:PREDICTED: WD repeat-containing protein 75 [Nanorana parkeri]|uniref:WD repeat-containing protein 75 n=1 Tax=Nanorana parkeri TaxID=125878 RepID=UPI0008543E2A|nr:PREDICTED: WD repeat-containing protein 75 [Nanorana parkeri]